MRHIVSISESGSINLSRRTLLTGAAAGIAAAGPASLFVASPAIARGRGAYRSLKLHNSRTSERLNTVYWVEGQYIPDALEAFYYMLCDWRQEEIIRIDTRTIDIMSLRAPPMSKRSND